MKNICVIYGSSTGTCQGLAEKIGQQLSVQDDGIMDVQNLSSDVIDKYDVLILGTSTWGAGEMQDDWYDGVKVLKQTGLEGKTVAVFGCGDSESYSDTFCGGMAELYNAAKEAGAKMIGEVPADGYTYDDSEAVVDGEFVGLALDEVNEDDKTDSRIAAWVEELKKNLD
jgi:flavodoxin I